MLNHIYKLLDEYQFPDEEKEFFLNIASPIIFHKEFIKRCDAKVFPHHGNVSLGSHIINDAIVTYAISKKKSTSTNPIDLRLAVIIALFHDLYEKPWQNQNNKKSMLINRHGFTHPIEAIVNAITWFPEYFESIDEAKIIIDGVIHHMYPFPVRSINVPIEILEINNMEKYKKIPLHLKALIIETTNINNIRNISFSKSKYIEGQVMASADKIVSFNKDLKSIKSILACVTGINPELENYQMKLK